MCSEVSCIGKQHNNTEISQVVVSNHQPSGLALQLHADLSVYSKFWVVKYSYIQAIVLSFVEQFPTIEHVSEDRKAFEVGEIFYLLF